MKKSDFNYDLPKELIAQTPIEPRTASRLLFLDKTTGETKDGHFTDLINYLKPGDCLIMNDTRVLPARIFGTRTDTGSVVEFVLLKQTGEDEWECLAGPGKKAKPGKTFKFGDELSCEVTDVTDGGNRKVKFSYTGVFYDILDRVGQMPLPPYITHRLQDKNRYQTVYAEHEGSAAAPTAGLHFTKELLAQIQEMGVKIAHVTLHVGLGTFRPVKVSNVLDHHMHSEFYRIEEDAANMINETKKNGGRIICVGTTSCRTIESAAAEDGTIRACSGWTDIFIYPGYQFKILDCLITNFHLPESTLVMLVSALAGREHVLTAYEEAIRQRYRFFSFGDAMFIQ